MHLKIPTIFLLIFAALFGGYAGLSFLKASQPWVPVQATITTSDIYFNLVRRLSHAPAYYAPAYDISYVYQFNNVTYKGAYSFTDEQNQTVINLAEKTFTGKYAAADQQKLVPYMNAVAIGKKINIVVNQNYPGQSTVAVSLTNAKPIGYAIGFMSIVFLVSAVIVEIKLRRDAR